MADQARLLKDFKDLTSCSSDEQARFFLESHNWDLEGAASAFFDEAMEHEPEAPAPALGPRIPYSGSATFEPQSAPAPPPARAPAPAAAPTGRPAPASNARASPPAAKPRFATLSDMKKAQQADDSGSDGEGPQDYFAGTGGDTGVALHDPNDPRLKNKKGGGGDKDLTDRIIDKAKKGGTAPPPTQDTASPAFTGAGFRLGTTMDAKESAEAQLAAMRAAGQAPAKKKKNVRTLTFYSNGFTVDEGPLRRFDDPANRSFLEDIEKGYAPRELEEEAGGEPVNINLVDKKGEEYKPPPGPKYTAFAGSGHTLGSSSSSAPSSSPAAHPTPASSTSTPPGSIPASSVGQAIQLEVDASKPTTTLQIRLHDGTRLVAKFNLTHTVQHIRNFCEAALPMRGKAYDLMTTFPNKVLTDFGVSIQDAGLASAAIVQKLK
eukprot:tig00001206_g7486.t1